MLRSLILLAVSAGSVMSASAAAAPSKPDLDSAQVKGNRVSVTLMNKSRQFRDVKIGSRSYTVLPNEFLVVKGPVGTTVYADSAFGKYHRGDTFLELTPSVDNGQIKLN